MGNIFCIERNIRGAWVIYGKVGIRQYDGYTKAEAVKRYKDECKRTVFENVKTKEISSERV